MIKLLFLLVTICSLSSCYVSGYDPYYVSAPSSIYVAPSIYSSYGYTHPYRNHYLRPYIIRDGNGCDYTPSYNHYHLRNRH